MYKNIESKKRRNYAATATAMDSMIGDVVELYKQFGYWDNTIVVFSSGIFENVELMSYFGQIRSNKVVIITYFKLIVFQIVNKIMEDVIKLVVTIHH